MTILHAITVAVSESDILDSQQTPHTSPSRVSYGVCIMRIMRKLTTLQRNSTVFGESIMGSHVRW